MSHLIRHEPCPRCRENGKDRTGNNLGVYSDNHSYCFNCGFFIPSNPIASYTNKGKYTEKQEKSITYLPSDCDTSYPQRALNWIGQYELTIHDLYTHNVLWSEYKQRLIFPIFDNGELLAYQGRSFNLDKTVKEPKWLGHGDLKNIFHFLGKGDKLILCEDIVSAIKLSNCGVMAMPLFGSHLGRERFKRLFSLFGSKMKVYVWLDYDKASYALSEAKLGCLCGLDCSTIVTKEDPKEISYEKLKSLYS